MNADFSRVLSLLRQEKGISQRRAAAALGISQALLSHYENGIREPGLNFVARACDYYHVSADYLLGRSLSRDGAVIEAEELEDASEGREDLKGSVMAKLQKKLLVNSTFWAGPTTRRRSPRAGRTSAGRCIRCSGCSTVPPAGTRGIFPLGAAASTWILCRRT